jgi:hypothetical protein
MGCPLFFSLYTGKHKAPPTTPNNYGLLKLRKIGSRPSKKVVWKGLLVGSSTIDLQKNIIHEQNYLS